MDFEKWRMKKRHAQKKPDDIDRGGRDKLQELFHVKYKRNRKKESPLKIEKGHGTEEKKEQR